MTTCGSLMCRQYGSAQRGEIDSNYRRREKKSEFRVTASVKQMKFLSVSIEFIWNARRARLGRLHRAGGLFLLPIYLYFTRT